MWTGRLENPHFSFTEEDMSAANHKDTHSVSTQLAAMKYKERERKSSNVRVKIPKDHLGMAWV